jgi:D-alanyl-D-alanine carboxypeptidase (penicillin-binding protein 5/6)
VLKLKYRIYPIFVTVSLSGVISLFWFGPCLGRSSGISLTAKSALVIDKKNNRIVYAKNHQLKLPMASTTKVMTALLALENLGLTQATIISYHASQTEPSKIYLRQKERWRSLDLLYALLMSSANDAAVSLAEEISGKESDFADLMNKKARELRMKNSRFANPCGFSHASHFSTCFDLARLWKKATAYPVFLEIMRTKNKTIVSEAGRKIYLRNHNRLLWNYPKLFIGKTGYTLKAKHCFVGELILGKRNFVIVILKSRKPWEDLKKIADFCQRIK